MAEIGWIALAIAGIMILGLFVVWAICSVSDHLKRIFTLALRNLGFLSRRNDEEG